MKHFKELLKPDMSFIPEISAVFNTISVAEVTIAFKAFNVAKLLGWMRHMVGVAWKSGAEHSN